MNMTNLPALLGATHVAFGTMTAERLERIGATNVARACDCLLVGPSLRDVAEHARMRQAWWNSPEKWDVYLSEVRWQPPIVVWVSSRLDERVNLWKTCSWLNDMGIACQDVLILEFEPVPSSGTPDEPLPPFNCCSSVDHHPDAVLLEHLEKARPWPRERYDRAVRLWANYVDENPLPFVESCLRGVEGFPELAPLWTLLSCFFPRRTSEGALRLSRFDELIFGLLSTEWKTPLALVAHESEIQMNLWHLLFCTGDLFLPRRLEHWADHSSSAFVERAPGPKPPNAGYPMLSEVYRLTERGMRLREQGLEQLTDAPSLPLAGTEAYSPSAPWVLLEDGRLARL
ncbi:hypothetical protein WME89_40975 [Sorangium sp. So ce321]|uniref:hypothetical protein n=1 Tax=Sorangium sp. So ce321 TaxID=3133300 RepID=UPI003F63E0CC